MYTDYTPGTTTATIRLASTTDADKVITALAAHRVFHTPNDSRSSSVCDKVVEDGQANAVTGELVTGERERIYWEECVWKGKRGKKAKERNYWDTNQEELVYDDYDVGLHGVNLDAKVKQVFEKDSGNSNFAAKSTGKHIKFRD